MRGSRLNNISIGWNTETEKKAKIIKDICENWHLSQHPVGVQMYDGVGCMYMCAPMGVSM